MSLHNDTATVIILYNPSCVQLENVLRAREKTRTVVAIDNSPDSHKEFFAPFPGVEYFHFPENAGISKALNFAARKLLTEDFTYMITLDQDSEFDYGCIEQLKDTFSVKPGIALVSPRHIHALYTTLPSGNEWEEVEQVMTSGNLLLLDAHRKIGGFDENLFIDYVDVDYCLRLRLDGFTVLINNKILMPHTEGDLQLKKLLFVEARIFNYSPFRWYYKTRNLFYLHRKFRKSFPEYLKKERSKFFRDFIKSMLFEPGKTAKIKAMIAGCVDFKKNRYGR